MRKFFQVGGSTKWWSDIELFTSNLPSETEIGALLAVSHCHMLVVKGEMYWLWWSMTNPSFHCTQTTVAILQLWREASVWRHHEKSLRPTTDMPFACLQRLWGFHQGFHVASWITQNPTLQWTYVPQELRPCLNVKDCHMFSSCFSALWIGNSRNNSFCTSYHQYNKISTLVLSITAGTGISYHFCWSSLCREAKGRMGCGRLNRLDLPSTWGYPPGTNRNILESFIAEQAFCFL